MGVRYPDTDNGEAATERYAEAVAQAAEKHPDDHDVRTLHAGS